jgi:molybdopterin molybdotransferase
VLPALRAMLGLGHAPAPRLHRAARRAARAPNGPREHYMRARARGRAADGDGEPGFSSLLGILSRSNALIVRPVGDGPRAAGEVVLSPLLTRSG